MLCRKIAAWPAKGRIHRHRTRLLDAGGSADHLLEMVVLPIMVERRARPIGALDNL